MMEGSPLSGHHSNADLYSLFPVRLKDVRLRKGKGFIAVSASQMRAALLEHLMFLMPTT